MEYAGKIEEGRSFSYRLEFETKIVGNISGQSGNDKFSVFKQGKNYKHTKKYGDNLEDAFLNVKNEILQVIDASIDCDYDTISNLKLDILSSDVINSGKLSPVVYKGKVK